MAARSEIEWTGHTWNITTGCSRVGPECDSCYAMNMAHRFDWGRHLTHKHPVKLKQLNGGRREVDMVDWTGEIDFHPDRLSMPLSWRDPAKVFVCSTSDLFHPKIPFEFVAAAFGVMATAKWHQYQVLTKRPKRMAEFFRWVKKNGCGICRDHAHGHMVGASASRRHVHRVDTAPYDWPLPNVWCGTSVGVRDAKHRIDELRKVPAVVRFLSLEPLLEDLGELNLRGIGWVIAGGESQTRARPMHPDWARSIRDQCEAAQIPFFYKQHGEFGPAEQFGEFAGRRHTFDDGQEVVRVGKKKAGRVLDGQTHDAMPEVA